jgi:hypothetical protein
MTIGTDRRVDRRDLSNWWDYPAKVDCVLDSYAYDELVDLAYWEYEKQGFTRVINQFDIDFIATVKEKYQAALPSLTRKARKDLESNAGN